MRDNAVWRGWVWRGVWLLLALHALGLLTTLLAVSHGAHEGNVLLAPLIPWRLVVVKLMNDVMTVVGFRLACSMWRGSPALRHATLAGMLLCLLLVGGAVANNLWHLLG